MKQPLFWKIFIGFWLTLLAMTQGTWLVFSLVQPPPEQSGYEREMASMSVTAAVSAIRMGGLNAFNQQLATWPRDQRNQLVVQPATGPDNAGPSLSKVTVSAPDGTAYRVYYRPVTRPHRPAGLVGTAEILITAAVCGFVFSAVLAWYLTRPVQQLRVGFARLAQGDLSTRLGAAIGRRRDEIANLAHDFDQMAVQLEELVLARDRLLADVSHELRTPLSRLNVAIELARQDPAKLSTSLDRISDEAVKLNQMVGELLTLAKMESGQKSEGEYLNFAEIVAAVVRDARYEADGKNVNVLMHIQPTYDSFEWIVKGNGKLISRAVENIVRNAVRYSPKGSNVNVALRQEGGSFRLVVTDEGPGVPQEAMGGLFKPFGFSADGFGFGLGLAIAQRAVTVHGGSISAVNRQPAGLEMVLALPNAFIESCPA